MKWPIALTASTYNYMMSWTCLLLKKYSRKKKAKNIKNENKIALSWKEKDKMSKFNLKTCAVNKFYCGDILQNNNFINWQIRRINVIHKLCIRLDIPNPTSFITTADLANWPCNNTSWFLCELFWLLAQA